MTLKSEEADFLNLHSDRTDNEKAKLLRIYKMLPVDQRSYKIQTLIDNKGIDYVLNHKTLWHLVREIKRLGTDIHLN